MTAIPKATIRDLADRMRDDGPAISPFVMTEVYKTFLGRSLEAMIPVTLRLIEAIRSGDVRAVDGIRIDAPDMGLYHHGLTIETGAGNFLVSIEMNNKPDPKLDAILEEIIGNRSSPRQERKPEPSEIKVVRFYTPAPPYQDLPSDALGCVRAVTERARHADSYRPTLEQAIAAVVKDSYIATSCAGTTCSYESAREDSSWSEGLRDVRDIDFWIHFFPALRAALQAYGLFDAHQADATAFEARKYQSMDRITQYAAAQALGDHLARADRFLPGIETVRGMRELESAVIENNFSQAVRDIPAIHAACLAHGHTSHAEAFDHNDLDNFVHTIDTGRPDTIALSFRDQNRCFAVFLDVADAGSTLTAYAYGRPTGEWFQSAFRDGITQEALMNAWLDSTTANPFADPPIPTLEDVVAAPLAGDAAPAPMGRFAIEGERLTPLVEPDIRQDAIRSWNSLISDIETAIASLEDEYDDVQAI